MRPESPSSRKPRSLFAALAVPLCAGLLAFSTAALADKPEWAGGGKGKHGKHQDDDYSAPRYERKHDHDHERDSYRFSDDSRRVVIDYYGGQARSGHCPPGLAKKNNGCLPPGQAKKWQVGQPLPRDLRYYELSPEVLRRLPPPPPRYRYVRVAGDVLMIAIGTSMVVDAIEDILR